MTASRLLLAAGLIMAATPAFAATGETSAAEAQTLALTKESIALRSVRGPGNETGKVAQLLADALRNGGWSADQVEIVPFDDTAYLIATWPGSDPALGPVVISAHLDVVEADPKDWERDPFTPVVENGLLYGRGASDTKFDAVQAMVAVMELRKAGFRPRRGIVIAYSGDEETTMLTSKVIAERLKHAHLVLRAVSTHSDPPRLPQAASWGGAVRRAGWMPERGRRRGHGAA